MASYRHNAPSSSLRAVPTGVSNVVFIGGAVSAVASLTQRSAPRSGGLTKAEIITTILAAGGILRYGYVSDDRLGRKMRPVVDFPWRFSTAFGRKRSAERVPDEEAPGVLAEEAAPEDAGGVYDQGEETTYNVGTEDATSGGLPSTICTSREGQTIPGLLLVHYKAESPLDSAFHPSVDGMKGPSFQCGPFWFFMAILAMIITSLFIMRTSTPTRRTVRRQRSKQKLVRRDDTFPHISPVQLLPHHIPSKNNTYTYTTALSVISSLSTAQDTTCCDPALEFTSLDNYSTVYFSESAVHATEAFLRASAEKVPDHQSRQDSLYARFQVTMSAYACLIACVLLRGLLARVLPALKAAVIFCEALIRIVDSDASSGKVEGSATEGLENRKKIEKTENVATTATEDLRASSTTTTLVKTECLAKELEEKQNQEPVYVSVLVQTETVVKQKNQLPVYVCESVQTEKMAEKIMMPAYIQTEEIKENPTKKLEKENLIEVEEKVEDVAERVLNEDKVEEKMKIGARNAVQPEEGGTMVAPDEDEKNKDALEIGADVLETIQDEDWMTIVPDERTFTHDSGGSILDVDASFEIPAVMCFYDRLMDEPSPPRMDVEGLFDFCYDYVPTPPLAPAAEEIRCPSPYGRIPELSPTAKGYRRRRQRRKAKAAREDEDILPSVFALHAGSQSSPEPSTPSPTPTSRGLRQFW
ncbi:hypothetical protein CPC08DRAFT_824624 [Agrocybe pediades]|nr:hypothetical protein CPC08DRAFT_824624 [Agrocybe pediades]